MPSPEERIRGVGYFGPGNRRLRRADLWMLVRGPQSLDLSEHVGNVRGRAVSWLIPHLVEYGIEPVEAQRRAFVYYMAYLGVASGIDARGTPVDDHELRALVDDVVDVVLTRRSVDPSVDEPDLSV